MNDDTMLGEKRRLEGHLVKFVYVFGWSSSELAFPGKVDTQLYDEHNLSARSSRIT